MLASLILHRFYLPSTFTAVAFISAIGLCCIHPAHAEIFKCTSTDGHIEYRSTACSASVKQKSIGTTGQSTENTASPAPERLGAATYSAKNAGNPDMQLAINCEGFQSKVFSLQERLQHSKAYNNATPSEESALGIEELKLQISEYERQGNEAGCSRVGLKINSPEARNQVNNLRCTKLTDELSFWKTGKGKNYPSAQINTDSLTKDIKKYACTSK